MGAMLNIVTGPQQGGVNNWVNADWVLSSRFDVAVITPTALLA